MRSRKTTSRKTNAQPSTAEQMAAATPSTRNRTIDFLRAFAIATVILGHWLVAAVWFDADGAINPRNLLALEPWTQWTTWVFQVMPLFFVVGGFANVASWRSARSKGTRYGTWLTNRFQRLIGPVIPLLGFWLILSMTTSMAGIDRSVLTIGSQAALVPVWFLAVYILLVAIAPFVYVAWERFGWRLFGSVAGLAIATDLLRIAGNDWIGWTNYLWVWVAAHLLGFAWHDNMLPSSLVLIGGGVASLFVLVGQLGYSHAMVGVPGHEFGNTFPPTVALLALGVLHVGIARLLEPKLEQWLQRPTPWKATIVVNGTIMSIYLWHLTVMVLVIGTSSLLGGWAMTTPAATTAWWLQRPIWVAVLAAVLLAALTVVGRFERSEPRSTPRSTVRVVVGGLLVCAGLAELALHSVIVDDTINWIGLGIPFVGAFIGGVTRPGSSQSTALSRG